MLTRDCKKLLKEDEDTGNEFYYTYLRSYTKNEDSSRYE